MDVRIKTDITSEILSAADVKPYIKYEDSEADEITLIDDMIKTVRTYLEQRTGSSFAQRTYEIFFKSDESPFILPVYPIISVDKVETVDYLGVKNELVLNSGYYKAGLYEVTILTSTAAIKNPFSESGTYNLLVTCKAGYGHADTETLPKDLLGAIKTQVFQWYENRDDFYEGNYLGMVDKIIKLYRRVWI
jgi:uncharacterized phiE125 gp8 family phage protein